MPSIGTLLVVSLASDLPNTEEFANESLCFERKTEFAIPPCVGWTLHVQKDVELKVDDIILHEMCSDQIPVLHVSCSPKYKSGAKRMFDQLKHDVTWTRQG